MEKKHGRPMVLEVTSGQMYRDGHRFYLSQNGVWLTAEVETRYIKGLDSAHPAQSF